MRRASSGAIECVGRSGSGTPLGVLPRANYEPVPVMLEPGDVVILFTDGVTDSMDRDRQPFGTERLMEVIAAASSRRRGRG